MGIFRKAVKNILPYCLVKKYQAARGGDPYEPGGYYSPAPATEVIKSYNFKADLPDKNCRGLI
jgi:hypothetical protein